MYLDRLDGRITPAFFDSKSKEWTDQQKQIEAQMKQLATTGLRSASEAVQIMKSVSDACRRFEDSQSQEQGAIAATLLENATWKAGKFESSWKSPFDNMALSNSASQTKERQKPGSGQDFDIWLPKERTFEWNLQSDSP